MENAVASFTLADLLPKAEKVEERGNAIVLTINGIEWSFPKSEYKEKLDDDATTKIGRSTRTRSPKTAN